MIYTVENEQERIDGILNQTEWRCAMPTMTDAKPCRQRVKRHGACCPNHTLQYQKVSNGWEAIPDKYSMFLRQLDGFE